jgi:hypothetical protein
MLPSFPGVNKSRIRDSSLCDQSERAAIAVAGSASARISVARKIMN